MPDFGRSAPLAVLLFAACTGGGATPPGDDRAGVDTSTDSGADTSGGDTSDTGCTPSDEGLEGEARIVCAPGAVGDDGYCVSEAAPTVWVTMSCDAYAESGEQVLFQELAQCAADLGVECCVCSFDLDPTCDPCEVND